MARRYWHQVFEGAQSECAHCEANLFEGGDPAYRRESEYDDLFCSRACGVHHERELSQCFDLAAAGGY